MHLALVNQEQQTDELKEVLKEVAYDRYAFAGMLRNYLFSLASITPPVAEQLEEDAKQLWEEKRWPVGVYPIYPK